MASRASTFTAPHEAMRSGSFLERIDAQWHERALWIYMAIVLAHWAEHLTQAVQIYALGWPTPEALHYGYAFVMLVGLWVLRTGFVGRSRLFWMIAFWIQFWHHIEHALLQGQAIFGQNLFGLPVPTSIAQLVVSRVELHLFYNTVVFVPMLIAMYYTVFPPVGESVHAACSCQWKPREARVPAK